jgi:MoxR-like ATPase
MLKIWPHAISTSFNIEPSAIWKWNMLFSRDFPVLIQGETSVGKTSLINWLAKASGNYCVRINNHEHTDIQEYLGCYTSDASGKLVFKEGITVHFKYFLCFLSHFAVVPIKVFRKILISRFCVVNSLRCWGSSLIGIALLKY